MHPALPQKRPAHAFHSWVSKSRQVMLRKRATQCSYVISINISYLGSDMRFFGTKNPAIFEGTGRK
jgi:hypothetical protein